MDGAYATGGMTPSCLLSGSACRLHPYPNDLCIAGPDCESSGAVCPTLAPCKA